MVKDRIRFESINGIIADTLSGFNLLRYKSGILLRYT